MPSDVDRWTLRLTYSIFAHEPHTAFVVENEHDKKVLMDECKDKRKLKISITELCGSCLWIYFTCHRFHMSHGH